MLNKDSRGSRLVIPDKMLSEKMTRAFGTRRVNNERL
jgi:hypothetical protein